MIQHRDGCVTGIMSREIGDWWHPTSHFEADGRCKSCGAGEPERSARGFTERQIRQTAHEERQRRGRHPTMIDVASALNTSEPTLKRAIRELGMGAWPPPPPED